MNKQENKKVFKYFQDYYKTPSSFSLLTELNMTPTEGFELRDISDMENHKSNLTNLIKLNISNNLLTKLSIKSIINLKTILAAKNMISEVSLGLNNLTTLDLSSNMISKMIDLSNIPNLITLNLNHNLIDKIYVKEIIAVKKTLKTLNLAYNRIKFESNEFIAFIEGMKVFYLEKFSLEGNKFILENLSLSNHYKIFIIALMPTLQFLNDEHIQLNRDHFNPKEIIYQILLDDNTQNLQKLEELSSNRDQIKIPEEKLIVETHKILGNSKTNKGTPSQNYFQKDPKSIGPPLQKGETNLIISSKTKGISFKNYVKDELKLKLQSINLIFESLNASNGSSQNLFLDLMKEINSCLSANTKDVIEKEEVTEEFVKFLMNCFLLIELESKYEITIYKIIAQFALYHHGDFFVEKCFDFFESLVKGGSSNRTENIVKVLETVIIGQIMEIKDNPPFKIVDAVVNFFSNTNIQCKELYFNLISTVINFIKYFDYQRVDNNFGDQYTQEELQNYITCFSFIKRYLDSELKDEDDEEEAECLSDSSLSSTSDLVSNESLEKISLHSKENFKNEYGFDLNDYEDRSDIFLEENLIFDEDAEDREVETTTNKYKSRKEFPALTLKENDKSKTINNNSIIMCLNEKEKNIIEKLSKKDIASLNENILEDKQEKYIIMFIIIYEKCSTVIKNYVQNYFTNSYSWKELQETCFQKCIELLITLSTRFTYHYEKFKLLDNQINLIKKHVSITNLATDLNEYLSDIISVYIEDVNKFEVHFDTIFLNKNQKDTQNEEKVLTKREANLKIKNFLINIIECYGCVIRLFKESTFKNELEKEVPANMFYILTLEKNDPFLLIGACKFCYHIMSNEDLQSDNMIFSKLMLKVSNFTVLLRYINNTDSSYKGVFEKISIISDSMLNEHILDPYSFDNLNSPHLIELFLSIISLFNTVANLSLAKGPISSIATISNKYLTDNHLHEYLGNCLRIQDDMLRKHAMKCIYYYDHDNIKNEVLDQIITIVSNYDSVTEGETEIILSTIYVILANIILNNNDSQFKFSVVNALNMAIDFINKNLDRNPTDVDEINQKNMLGISLNLFLNICGKFKEFKKILKPGIENNFRNIMYNDYVYYNSNNYLPLEIERSQLGNYIGILAEVTRNDTPIYPFSYPFVRVLLKMADVVSNVEEFTYSTDYSQDMEILIKKLGKEVKTRQCFRIINEKSNWYEFNCDVSTWIKSHITVKSLLSKVDKAIMNTEFKFVDGTHDKNSNYDVIRQNILKKLKDVVGTFDSKKVTNLNTVNELDIKLSIIETFNGKDDDFNKVFRHKIAEMDNKKYEELKKEREKEQYNGGSNNKMNNNNKIYECSSLPKLFLEELIKEQINFTAYFSSLMMFIFGKTSNLQESEISKNLLLKADEKIITSKIETNDQQINDTGYYNPNTLNLCRKEYSLDSDSNEDFKINFLMGITNKKNIEKIFKDNTTLFYYNKFSNDLETFDLFGFDIKAKRLPQEETENNPHLRSLITSSLLRCVYSILISPSKEISNNLIEILFIDEKWKNFLVLIDSSYMFEYSIANKALNVFEAIFNKFKFVSILSSFSYKHNTNEISAITAINEEKLIHSLYAFSVYLEKTLYHYKERYFKSDKYDYIFVRDLINVMHGFLFLIVNYNFQKYDVEYLILKRLLKEEFTDILINHLKSLQYANKKVYKKLNRFFVLKSENYYIDVIYDYSRRKEEHHLIETEIENYLCLFGLNVEKSLTKLYQLLALIMKIYPKCKNYILDKILNLQIQQERAVENLSYQKMKYEKLISMTAFKAGFVKHVGTGMDKMTDNEDKDSIIQEKKNYISQIKQNYFENVIHYQKIFEFSNQIREQFFKEPLKEQILFCEVSECQNLKEKLAHKVYLVITNINVLFFDYLSMEGKNKIEKLKQFLINDIKKIFIYEYNNRLIFETNNDKVSLLFTNFQITNTVQEIINYYQPNIPTININIVQNYIILKETEKTYIKHRQKDKENIRDKSILKNKNEDTLNNEISNYNLIFEEIKKEFKINNNIYTNLYEYDDLKIQNLNCFLLMIVGSEKKVAFISNFFLYILKENFEKLEELPDKVPQNNTIILNIGSAYEIKQSIKLDNIYSLSRQELLCTSIEYYKDDDRDKLDSLTITFQNFYDECIFIHKLDSAIKDLYFEDAAIQIKSGMKN